MGTSIREVVAAICADTGVCTSSVTIAKQPSEVPAKCGDTGQPLSLYSLQIQEPLTHGNRLPACNYAMAIAPANKL